MEVHAQRCKSHCNGGVKVALGIADLRRCARGKWRLRVVESR